MFTHAIVRRPGPNAGQGLTGAGLGAPDYERLLLQHQAYVDALSFIGLEVVVLESGSDYPDGYFVEDTAVVTPEVAVVTRPGAPSRQGEVASVASALEQYLPLRRIEAPGILDGGDVLMVDGHFLVGISERTNEEGARQLGDILADYGYSATTIAVRGGLHLKSGINAVGRNVVLATSAYADLDPLHRFARIVLHPDEEYAGNTLWVNDCILMPEGFPKTKAQLQILDLEIMELDVSEIRKMDGGLTCLSIRF